jgi:hypothetical protein
MNRFHGMRLLMMVADDSNPSGPTHETTGTDLAGMRHQPWEAVSAADARFAVVD